MLRDAAENRPEAASSAPSLDPRSTSDPDTGTSESVDGNVALPPLDQIQVIEAAGGQIAYYSAVSPLKFTSNEDSVCVVPVSNGCIVLGVADGLGGHRDGAQASQLVVSSVRQRIAEHVLPLGLSLAEGLQPRHAAAATFNVSPAKLRTAILEGVESANDELLNNGSGSASTLALIELMGTRIRTYHVGDSAILVVGQRGRLKRQTVCHSPVGYALEAGLLDEEEALYHEERHVVSNVVGIADMRIELGPPLQLASRDTVLLATDGLYDNLWQDEIVEAIRKGPLQEGVHRLVSLATRRMLLPDPGHPSKPDDLSIVAFRLKPPKRKRRSRKRGRKLEGEGALAAESESQAVPATGAGETSTKSPVSDSTPSLPVSPEPTAQATPGPSAEVMPAAREAGEASQEAPPAEPSPLAPPPTGEQTPDVRTTSYWP